MTRSSVRTLSRTSRKLLVFFNNECPHARPSKPTENEKSLSLATKNTNRMKYFIFHKTNHSKNTDIRADLGLYLQCLQFESDPFRDAPKHFWSPFYLYKVFYLSDWWSVIDFVLQHDCSLYIILHRAMFSRLTYFEVPTYINVWNIAHIIFW